jgi:hypothetical protein
MQCEDFPHPCRHRLQLIVYRHPSCLVVAVFVSPSVLLFSQHFGIVPPRECSFHGVQTGACPSHQEKDYITEVKGAWRMAEKKCWVLTDVEHGVWQESFALTHTSAKVAGGEWSIIKRRLHGGLQEGVDVIEVNNGRFCFTIVPTRGMGLWAGNCDGYDVGWRAPVKGPVNPCYVNAGDRGGLGWLQGFDECIVRCGLDSNGPPGTDIVPNNNGNPSEVTLTLHGRIANVPAYKVGIEVNTDGDRTQLVVTGEVEESMLFFPHLRLCTRYVTEPGANYVRIEDTIVNANSTDREMELLYHCNFGEPFLEADARLVSPSEWVAPRDARAAEGINSWDTYGGPTPGFIEQCNWHKLTGDASGNTLAMLRNAAGDKAVVIRHNIRELPYFTQWKNTAATVDGYVTGLEPGTNLPNLKTFERKQGRVVKIPAGGAYRVNLTMEVLGTPAQVQAATQEVARLQGGGKTVVHPKPLPEFSPIA